MSSKPWLKYRRGNFFSVTFPTLPSLTAKPSEVDLYQERSSHDILELVFIRESQKWSSLLKTGTPVIFSWSQGSEKKVWTGYVNHVSTQSASQQERTMKVVCVGASYKLKERAAKTWKNKTVPEVAALIAKQFRLKLVTDPSSRRFDQLSMTGQTYWQWLQEYAAKIGYGFYVENTTMYLRPIHKLVNESASNAPVMGLELPSPSANTKVWDRTLDSFVIQKGDYFDNAEAKYTNKVTSGVNPLTSKVINTSSSPSERLSSSTRTGIRKPLFDELSTEVVHTSAFSKQTAKDLAFAARFVVTAKVRGQGDPRIRPYGAVYIHNTNSETDGFWVVNKVHHAFNITGLYEVDLEVATDGIGANNASLFRKAKGLGRGTIDVESLVINNDLSNGSSRTGTRLITKTPLIKETDQGFGKTNLFWSGN